MRSAKRVTRLLATASVIVLCVACAPPESRAADTALKRPATFTLAEFDHLHWIEGKWRGTSPDGKTFHTAFHFVDDSTLRTVSYADSTFNRVADSATVSLRSGVIVDQGSADPWNATRLDTNGVNFAEVKAPGNRLTWVRESPDRWTVLIFLMHDGLVQRTVTPMVRMQR